MWVWTGSSVMDGAEVGTGHSWPWTPPLHGGTTARSHHRCGLQAARRVKAHAADFLNAMANFGVQLGQVSFVVIGATVSSWDGGDPSVMPGLGEVLFFCFHVL